MPVDPTTGTITAGQAARADTRPDRVPTPEEETRAAPGRSSGRRAESAQQRADKKVTYGAPDRHVDLLRTYAWRTIALPSNAEAEILTDVESLGWIDGSAIMTGSLTVRDSSFGIGLKRPLVEGDRVRLLCNGGQGFRELWTMRIYAPAFNVSGEQRTYRLANDLDLLRRSSDDLDFSNLKGKPNGWSGDEMIREICRLFGVRIGGIAKMKFRRKKAIYRAAKQGDLGVLGVIQEILNVERVHSGNRYTVRWDRDALWVYPLTRSPHLLALGPSLIDAAYSSALPSAAVPSTDSFASAISIRGLKNAPAGTDKKGNKKKKPGKMRVELESPASRRRFGYVHRVVWSPDADTIAELKEQGLQYLALIGKPVRELTLTHAGMPELRRGDAIRLGLGDEALRQQLVWVTEASFALSPSDFSMSLTVSFDDPYVNKKTERISDKLASSMGAAAGRRAKAKPVAAGKAQRTDETTEGGRLLEIYEGSQTVDTAEGGAGGR